MPVQAIDNSGVINVCNDCGTTGFTPVVSYTYDASAKTVAVQDGSTFPSGDSLKKVHVRVLDDFGGEVRDTITVTGAGGAKTINVASLNASKGLKISATVITANNIVADGNALPLAAAGSLSNWDVQKDA